MVCLFDRGYPSIRLVDHMIENKQFFAMRLKTSDFVKECAELNEFEDDKWLDISYDSKRSN